MIVPNRASFLILTALESILGIALILCVGALLYRLSADLLPQQITLMDRPRDPASSPDFLTRYLDATGTDYSIEDGYLRIPVSENSVSRLRGLLAAMGAAMDLIHEDRRKAVARAFTRSESNNAATLRALVRHFAEPTSDGKIAVTSQSITWDPSTWQEIDDQLASLEGQYRAVAEALRILDPSTVVPHKFTPIEPTSSSNAKVAAIQVGQDDADSPNEEILELNRVEPDEVRPSRAGISQTAN